jgi:DNA-directed RNA polymerase subunit RPC12/RpoP
MAKPRTRRRYVCVDCGQIRMFLPQEMARRSKPHCTECGSTFFNPASEGAIEQIRGSRVFELHIPQ